jgi:NRPS condensation-like uncharacterized protein
VPPVDQVSWRTGEALAGHRQALLASAPPLDLGPPLRIRHAVGPGQDALILNVHHAAMDGLSCLRVLRSIARSYAGLPDPVGAGPAVRTPVARPGSPGGPDSARTRGLRPVTRISADSAERGPGCGFELLSVPISSVRSEPEKPAATVNDVLIAALVRTVEEWNATHGAGTGTVRITMPVNARACARADEPLGNLSRLTVITNKRVDRCSADRLLTDVSRQTRVAKQVDGPQIDPFSELFVTPLLPVAVKARLLAAARWLAGRATGDTVLLSNLGPSGDLPDFGPGAGVAGLWFSSPVRMPAGLSVGAITLGDRLNLCFRYRRELFDPPAAARFATRFRAALAGFADPRFDPALMDEDRCR